MTIVLYEHEPRPRLKHWKLQRRARKAAKELMLGAHGLPTPTTSPFRLVLQPGRFGAGNFLVHFDPQTKEIHSVAPQGERPGGRGHG